MAITIDRKILERFTARDAVRVSGIRTPSMLDYLARSNIVIPSIQPTPGRGKRRYYSFTDLVVLRMVAQLLAQGLSPKRLKLAFVELRRQLPLLQGDKSSALFLITDGKHVIWRKSASELVDLTDSGQLAFSFFVDARKITDAVELEVSRLRSRLAA